MLLSEARFEGRLLSPLHLFGVEGLEGVGLLVILISL